jgi:hypothetical protein
VTGTAVLLSLHVGSAKGHMAARTSQVWCQPGSARTLPMLGVSPKTLIMTSRLLPKMAVTCNTQHTSTAQHDDIQHPPDHDCWSFELSDGALLHDTNLCHLKSGH